MKKIILIIGFLLLILPQNSFAARLWSSGFELQSLVTGVETGSLVNSSVAISTDIKRSGAASMRFNPNSTLTYYTYNYSLASPTVDHYFRFYLYIATAPAQNTEDIFHIQEDASMTASIRLNNNRTLELWDEGTTTPVQLGSDSSALDLATWYRIELAYDYIGAADYTVTAYIDGVQFATGDDVGGTIDQPYRVRFGVVSSQTDDLYFDDMAINDSTGTVQTGLPGAGSIVHLWPDSAGDTDTSTSTPDGWQQVDESPTPDDDTSVAWLDDNGDMLDVNFQSSASAGINSYDNITLVQGGIRTKAAISSSQNWQLGFKSQSNGTVQSGTLTTHNDTAWQTNTGVAPRNYSLTSYVDPQGGGALTSTLLDTMQLRASTTDASPDFGISTLWALVEYTAGTPPATAVAVRVIINNIKMIINGMKMIIP